METTLYDADAVLNFFNGFPCFSKMKDVGKKMIPSFRCLFIFAQNFRKNVILAKIFSIRRLNLRINKH